MAVNDRIVVCGESLMDVFLQSETPTGLALNAVVGGSPLNVAMGIARLAAPSSFFGGVSSDFLGERIQKTIEAEGIDTSCLVHLDAPTTLSLVGVDAQGVPSYRFYGHGAADLQVTVADAARVPQDAAAIHVGSYACVVPPVGDTIRTLITERHARCVIAYDPNVRLNVEPDLQVWRDNIDWMASRTHLLKLSDEDLARLYPETSADELAQRWLSAGVSLVMLTRGGDGASCWTREGKVEVTAPKVQVVDTVGAGDTFQACTLVGLAELGRLTPQGLASVTLDEVRRLATWAAGAAAITCTRRGPDLPRRDELPTVI